MTSNDFHYLCKNRLVGPHDESILQHIPSKQIQRQCKDDGHQEIIRLRDYDSVDIHVIGATGQQLHASMLLATVLRGKSIIFVTAPSTVSKQKKNIVQKLADYARNTPIHLKRSEGKARLTSSRVTMTSYE
ncbi:hypothetical protein DICVIV_04626 [Dictyocaulus viviparus]|uniref:Uncharacterized protein n=1 Tax=Dictyocaulus viviparus TaxID=29172 RepID=A0A0D8Y3W3_DICVI|nr:hypothetical protein DICVIV_04626 [Dictyocaulus viviparus]